MRKSTFLIFLIVFVIGIFTLAIDDISAQVSSVQNKVTIVRDAKAVKYNPMIFGQFIEHFDNQIYGGIYDPGSPLSDEDGIVKRTTYYVLWMYTNLLEENVLPVEGEFAKLSRGDQQTGVFDVVLTADKEGKRRVYAVVNKSPDEDIDLTIDLNIPGKSTSEQVKATVLSGNSPDDYNDRGRENVIPQQRILKVHDGKVSIPAHSLTFVEVM